MEKIKIVLSQGVGERICTGQVDCKKVMSICSQGHALYTRRRIRNVTRTEGISCSEPPRTSPFCGSHKSQRRSQ
jgi:hypothetical protein